MNPLQNLPRHRKPIPCHGERYRLRAQGDDPSTEVAVEILDVCADDEGVKVTCRPLDRVDGVLEPLRGAELYEINEAAFQRIFVKIEPGE